MNYANGTATLENSLWPKDMTLSRYLVLILSGLCLLTVASQLSIPLNPVPLTFQSATVILIGFVYGPRYASHIILAYLIAGILGIPVFADFSGGLVKLIGPTGGYLVGFLPAVFLTGYLAQKGFSQTILTSFITACLGTAIILVCGVSWLATLVGWQNAIALGAAPFILSEAIKLGLVAIFGSRIWKPKT